MALSPDEDRPSGTIVDHFLQHPEKVHFTFDHGNGHVREYPGLQLASEAAGLALRFRELGVRPGDRVAVVVPTSEPLLRTIVAAWFCRAAIVVLPHRLGGTRSSASAVKLARMLQKVAPTVVVGNAAVEDSIRPCLESSQHYIDTEIIYEVPSASPDSAIRPRAEDLAVLQFSSGSTIQPKAARISHAALLNSILTSSEPARPNGEEVIVNWLPAYHDFGFSAIPWCLATANRMVAMPTEAFVADPLSWLKAISRHRGTLAACPPFAMDLVSQLAPRLRGVDLSSWKYIWCAAEPIFLERIQRFERALQPHGLRLHAVKPAYGLAEAVVGVTVGDLEMPVATASISRSRFRLGEVVVDTSSDSIRVVGCGRPVRLMQVRIAGEEGNPVPQSRRGRIWIKGPSVTEGYWGESKSPLKDGWLDTGDEGFLLDGQLYVCGRTKDTLIRGGVNFDAHEIEDAVERALAELAPEMRCRASAVFAVRDDLQQRERAVAVLEVKRRPEDADAMFNSVRLAVLDRTGLGLDDIGYALPPGLPRTTSGKLQRSRAREMYEAGEFSA